MSALPRKLSAKPGKTAQDFTALVDAVRQVHDACASAVNRTVNTTLTLRNWLIGGYIRDYEQNGADRAQYGVHLLEKLSDSLQGCLDRCYTGRYLGLCRQLFDAYPSIRKSLISESGVALPLKRAFYEIECIRGNWSVRALKRQIATLYYERSGLSMDKEKLADMAHSAAEKAEPKLAIRDPHIFESIRNATAHSPAEKSSSATGGNDVRLTLAAKKATIGALP